MKNIVTYVLAFFVGYFGHTVYIQKQIRSDIKLIHNLKAACEEVHKNECEISVYYLPKASVPYDGQ